MTATLSVDAVQDSGTDVVVVVPAVRPVGAEGAVVSVTVPVWVVAETAEDAAETLPARSLALTVNEYAVAADRPVTV